VIYSFHPEAELEFINAADYYENKLIGLGLDFSIEVYSTIEKILAYPKAWPVMGDDIRRSLVRRFPFGVPYSVFEEEIYIIAVMNLNREPNYWKDRI